MSDGDHSAWFRRVLCHFSTAFNCTRAAIGSQALHFHTKRGMMIYVQKLKLRITERLQESKQKYNAIDKMTNVLLTLYLKRLPDLPAS